MKETTPFRKKYNKYTDDEEQQQHHQQRDVADTSDDYYYEDEEYTIGQTTKYVLWTLLAFLTLGMLYFFTVFLPDYFIPEATTLVKIRNISDLQVSLIPDASHPTKKPISRLILIGDIHGHYIELRKLLSKVKYNKQKDHVVVLGDFITKGPDSFKVLDFLIDNEADCVLGNHEYYVLQYYATFHGLDQPEFMYNSPATSPVSTSGSFNDDPEFILAKKLTPRYVKYINECSIMKRVGAVPGGLDGVAVHAGLRPDLTLAEQNPAENLEMRSLIGPYFNESTSDPATPGAKSWSKIYDSKNGEAPADHVVYYGHDAGRGLKLKKYTKGLDSGCDKGGKLSAMVISKLGKKVVEEVVQINC
ncbi:hypothetical protein Cantr_01103 [Candida viswanathii]|uniref:Calcineurin-like phosphoesterase domain-containing protein n=1 Tax=Candida viswanathii TaxID=5486 RepID=A0A367YIG9_9ASCO|nr:hypothetical protein Cantr_01103 [Candida viswanathii]